MALYELKKNPFPGKEPGDEELLYPHLVRKGTVPTNELAELISAQTTFTPGEVAGLLRTLAECMAHCMKRGQGVKLDGIGYFWPSIKGKPVVKKTEINANDIRFDRVNFRACKEFRSLLQTGDIFRARNATPRSPKGISDTRKKELIREYIGLHGQITRTEYSALTGILKNKALQDLHRFAKEGFIRSRGYKSTLRFVKGEYFGVEDGK